MSENKTENSINNDDALFNLIQNIQSKLNSKLDNSEIENNNEKTTKNYENIENTNLENCAQEEGKEFDMASILTFLQNMNHTPSGDGNLFDSLDPKLFIKIQKIVLTLGKKDPKKDLLLSLKPFLRKSRQDKIGEYITILTIIKAFEAFNDKGSDKNV